MNEQRQGKSMLDMLVPELTVLMLVFASTPAVRFRFDRPSSLSAPSSTRMTVPATMRIPGP